MFRKHILMNQATEGSNAGGTDASAQTPPDTTSTESQGSSDDKALQDMYGNQDPTKVQGQQTQQGTQTAEAGKTTEAASTEESTGASTGYETPPPAPGTGEQPAGEPAKTETAPTTEIKFDETVLSKDQIDKLKKFATDHKLPQSAVDEYTTLVKAADSNFKLFKDSQEKAVKEAAAKKHTEWYNTLKTDKEFGGEQFDANLKRVNTVLDKYFPAMKNLLTTTKTMLPPDVMKDLQKLHTVLLGSSQTIVNPASAQMTETISDDQKFLNDFYK